MECRTCRLRLERAEMDHQYVRAMLEFERRFGIKIIDVDHTK